MSTKELRPADIVSLGQWLTANQMRVDPGQLSAATRVLADLPKGYAPSELAPRLAPIFCTSAAEQANFRQLYRDWLVSHGLAATVSVGPVTRRLRAEKRRWSAWLIISVLASGLVVALLWYSSRQETVVIVTKDAGIQGDPTITTEPVVTRAADAKGRTVLRYHRWQLPIKIEATHKSLSAGTSLNPVSLMLESWQPEVNLLLRLPPAKKITSTKTELGERIALLPPPPSRQLPGTNSSVNTIINYYVIVASAIIAALAGMWWLISAARRRGFLERLPADAFATRHFIAAKEGLALAAHAPDLRYLSREMRRRRYIASSAIDVHSTLKATIKSGGYPSIKFGARAEREYLILVDYNGLADHLARLADEVIRTFLAQGVCLERYVFDADPRWLTHAPLEGSALHAKTQTIEMLQERHAAARLIIFSDGDALIDRYTGRPAEYVSCLAQWESPILITPQPVRLWTSREWQLSEAGLLVLPLDSTGFRQLSAALSSEVVSFRAPATAALRSRRAYLRDEDVLFDRRSPSEVDIEHLLRELRDDLGSEAFDWLAACAIYPEVHWPITLIVGDALHPELPAQGRSLRYARQLAQLARLPWLRIGFLPDWLRAALLRKISPAKEGAVRGQLGAFLATVRLSEKDKHGLVIATTPMPTVWRDVLSGIRAWRTMRPAPMVNEDLIFLKFMSGPRKALTVDADQMLSNLLYRDSASLAGPKKSPVFAALALAVGVLIYMSPVEKATQSLPGQLVLSVPRLIAFSDEGMGVASVTDAGLITRHLIGATGSNQSTDPCDTSRAGPVSLTYGENDSIRYLASGAQGMHAIQIAADCKPVETVELYLLRIATDYRNGKLVTEINVPRNSDTLCEGVDSEVLTAVGRRFAGLNVAACSFARDQSILHIATSKGKILEIPLRGGVARRRELAALGSVAPDIVRMEASSDGKAMAVVRKDGSIWVLRDVRGSWSSLGMLQASGPIAWSTDRRKLAFAKDSGEIEIWTLKEEIIAVAPPPPPPGPTEIADITVPNGPIREMSDKTGIPFAYLASVHFGPDSYVVNEAGKATIDELVSRSRGSKTVKIHLAGNVEFSSGGDEYSLALGMKLAEAVRKYLSYRGFDDRTIEVVSKGREDPVGDNRTALGRAANRRVDIRWEFGVDQ